MNGRPPGPTLNEYVDSLTGTATARKARLVFVDVEAAPMRARTFGYYETNVLKVEMDQYLFCAAWQWAGRSTIDAVSQDLKRGAVDDDRPVVEALWEVFDQAQIVVAHNADRFDVPLMNARFAVHDLPAPSPFKSIDTLKVARRHLKLPSNALGEIARYYGLGAKESVQYGALWERCEANDPKAWAKMVKYCRQDVRLLPEVYWRLTTYMSNPPNMATLSADPTVCPRCGANESLLTKTAEPFRTNTIEYDMWRCGHCGGHSRSRRRRVGQQQVDRVNVTRL